MGKKPSWDLTSQRSLTSAAKWVCEGSGALAVLVIREGDVAIWADPKVAPRDTLMLLETRIDKIRETLQERREAARAKQVKAVQVETLGAEIFGGKR